MNQPISMQNGLTIWIIIISTASFASCMSKQESSGTPSATTNTNISTLLQPSDVFVTPAINQEWAASGKTIYKTKCQSCHKLTADKMAGPGWAGITKQREPHWIMNMMLHTDVMLENDPEAKRQLKEYMVRMPDQGLTKEEARQVLEFMRSNDTVQ
jgi:mono/diheme cytochrome c family protein